MGNVANLGVANDDCAVGGGKRLPADDPIEAVCRDFTFAGNDELGWGGRLAGGDGCELPGNYGHGAALVGDINPPFADEKLGLGSDDDLKNGATGNAGSVGGVDFVTGAAVIAEVDLVLAFAKPLGHEDGAEAVGWFLGVKLVEGKFAVGG